MRGIFVVGTDTGVGKSVITGLLGKYLREKGLRVITQKWIQTGSRLSADINMHLKIMGMSQKKIKDHLNLVCPYKFLLPASPHLAAKEAKQKIDIARIKQSFKLLSSKFDFVIVEGIGGALVPINQKYMVIDIARELSLPVLVVAHNKLGAINHTLMTIEAINNRKMKILGILFNNQKREKKLILKDNPDIIKKITKQKIIGILPWEKSLVRLYRKFLPLAKRIIA
jgi:dethiobiotin synthetase